MPTLHVLFIQPHDQALLERPYPKVDTRTSELRDELIDWIAEQALGYDRDAAEWVLLTSIARV